MTGVWPTTTHTRYYSADLTLSLNPLDSNHLQARTVLGDIDVVFRGLAPGVVARPEVRTDITSLLARSDLSLDQLEPTQEELAAAVRHAAIMLGLKFVGGALLVAVLSVVAYDLIRRRRPTTRLVVTAVAAWLVASLGTGVATWATYQPSDRRRSPRPASSASSSATPACWPTSRRAPAGDALLPQPAGPVAGAPGEVRADDGRDATRPLRLLLVSDIHGGRTSTP